MPLIINGFKYFIKKGSKSCVLSMGIKCRTYPVCGVSQVYSNLSGSKTSWFLNTLIGASTCGIKSDASWSALWTVATECVVEVEAVSAIYEVIYVRGDAGKSVSNHIGFARLVNKLAVVFFYARFSAFLLSIIVPIA